MKFLFLFLKIHLHRFFASIFYFNQFGSFPADGVIINDFKSIKFGKDISIADHCTFYCQDYEIGSRLEIGNGVKFNRNVMLNSDKGGQIYVGDDVLFGPNVVVRAANHNYLNPKIKIKDQGHTGGKIEIANNVWISANVTILANVKIGTGAVVAAGAVVTKDVRAFSVVAGVPAREIKLLSTDSL